MNAFRDGLVAVPDDSPAASPSSSSSCLTLRGWEGLMRQGVEAARAGLHTEAEGLYLRALDVAQTLLYLAPGEHPCADEEDHRVAAFVVSRFNLADLYRDADRLDESVAHLCAAHRTLMALLRNERTSAALQQAACRHSRETHAALLEHLREFGGHPGIAAVLRAGCLPFPPSGATVH